MTSTEHAPCSVCRPTLRQRAFAWGMAQLGRAHERAVGERKARLFAGLDGEVLEIGPGAGVNLPYFGEQVRWLGIEPNPAMHGYLEAEARRLGRTADVRLGRAEALPADTGSVDHVVSTLVLCSVPDLAETLDELRRVLKPGGTLRVLEHVAAPRGSPLRSWQERLAPVQRFVGEGCEPHRETLEAIEAAGFAPREVERFTVRGAALAAPHLVGVFTR